MNFGYNSKMEGYTTLMSDILRELPEDLRREVLDYRSYFFAASPNSFVASIPIFVVSPF